ncbi:MAG: aminoglycoside phosphotransferase family protein [Candidatus Nanopelagicales bacterium]
MIGLTPEQEARLAEWGLEALGPVDDHPFAWWGRRGAIHVVIKTGDAAARAREAEALQAFTAGVAQLAEFDASLGLLVTERMLPGDDIRPLARANDDEATRCVAEVALMLRTDQAAAPGLPPLASIGEAFDGPPDARLPQDLRDRAQSVFQALISTPVDAVVLHGDLHHMNVLRSPDGWRAIDPHGWIGDPAFEPAALLANPRGLVDGGDARGMDGRELAVRARRRAEIYADLTGTDLERVRAWGFVGCVIAELWMLESHDLVHGAPLAVAQAMIETL